MSDGFIRIWCGDRQRLGHLGDAQDDFNFLGHVERTEELESLTCTVNGLFPPWRLTVGDRDDGFEEASGSNGTLQRGHPHRVTAAGRE